MKSWQMEQLAKDNGQKLYDGTVMLGQLLQCHYSSAGSSSGGHHFIDLSRKSKTEALFESRFKAWYNSPEKTQNRIIPAQMMDDMEALGREYKIDTWEPFRETDLIALDAASRFNRPGRRICIHFPFLRQALVLGKMGHAYGTSS